MHALLKSLRQLTRTTRLSILSLIVAAGLVTIFFMPRVPLGPDYHRFVDNRTMFGIPNGLDVLSNVLFLIVGLWGVTL